MKLEARFLIAYYHVRLFEQYGPIPIIRGAVDPECRHLRTDGFAQQRRRGGRLARPGELRHCPGASAHGTRSEMAGRPLRGAALAVRARLLLLAASPLYNSPDGYRGLEQFGVLQNKDGKRLFPQSYDETKWKRAADAAKEVINLNIYSLHKTASPTGDEKVDAFNSYREVFTKPGNKEVIFARDDRLQRILPGNPAPPVAGRRLHGCDAETRGCLLHGGRQGYPRLGKLLGGGFTTDPEAITLNRYVTGSGQDRPRVQNVPEPRTALLRLDLLQRPQVGVGARRGQRRRGTLRLLPQRQIPGRPNQDSPKTGYTIYKYVGVGDYKYKQSARTRSSSGWPRST